MNLRSTPIIGPTPPQQVADRRCHALQVALERAGVFSKVMPESRIGSVMPRTESGRKLASQTTHGAQMIGELLATPILCYVSDWLVGLSNRVHGRVAAKR